MSCVSEIEYSIKQKKIIGHLWPCPHKRDKKKKTKEAANYYKWMVMSVQHINI